MSNKKTNAGESSELSAFLSKLTDRIIQTNTGATKEEALRIADVPDDDILLLFHYAGKLKQRFRGDKVSLCSIVNAKSGVCPEDCSFCAQSAHYNTGAAVYPMLETSQIVEAAKNAKKDGAHSFGIVTSGQGIQDKDELREIGELVKAIRLEVDIDVHGSLGLLTKEQLVYLKDCGITEINHNLETSERFFPQICTTHSFQDRVETLRNIQASGMKVCAGGIFGMGKLWRIASIWR